MFQEPLNIHKRLHQATKVMIPATEMTVWEIYGKKDGLENLTLTSKKDRRKQRIRIKEFR